VEIDASRPSWFRQSWPKGDRRQRLGVLLSGLRPDRRFRRRLRRRLPCRRLAAARLVANAVLRPVLAGLVSLDGHAAGECLPWQIFQSGAAEGSPIAKQRSAKARCAMRWASAFSLRMLSRSQTLRFWCGPSITSSVRTSCSPEPDLVGLIPTP